MRVWSLAQLSGLRIQPGCGCSIGGQLQLPLSLWLGNFHILQVRPPKKSKKKKNFFFWGELDCCGREQWGRRLGWVVWGDIGAEVWRMCVGAAGWLNRGNSRCRGPQVGSSGCVPGTRRRLEGFCRRVRWGRTLEAWGRWLDLILFF